jgi:hypothetical protein
MNRRAPPAAAVLLLAGSLVYAGCETFVEAEDCDPSAENNPLIGYDGGIVDSPCAYDSTNPITGELLLFNGGYHYALNHHLACPPFDVEAKISFDRFSDGGQLAIAAGNQAVFTPCGDTQICVINDSCSDYWLEVTATVDLSTCPACR